MLICKDQITLKETTLESYCENSLVMPRFEINIHKGFHICIDVSDFVWQNPQGSFLIKEWYVINTCRLLNELFCRQFKTLSCVGCCVGGHYLV